MKYSSKIGVVLVLILLMAGFNSYAWNASRSSVGNDVQSEGQGRADTTAYTSPLVTPNLDPMLQTEEYKTAKLRPLVAGDNDGSRYATSSILAQGTYYKISVQKSGLIKLTYSDLQKIGLSDPSKVHVYGYGGKLLSENFDDGSYLDDLPQVSIYMEKGSDGVFNAGDYIVFYVNGVIGWDFDSYTKTYTHTINHYADEGYYFLKESNEALHTIEARTPLTTTANDTLTEFLAYQVHELDSMSLISMGRRLFGETFHLNAQRTFNFSTPNLCVTPSSIALSAIASSMATSTLSVAIDQQVIKTLSFSSLANSSFYEKAKKSTTTTSFTPQAEGDQLTVDLAYSSPNDYCYLDYIELNYYRKTKLVPGQALFLCNPASYKTNATNLYKLSDCPATTQVWDVTDPSEVKQVETIALGNDLGFKNEAISVHHYVALDLATTTDFVSWEKAGVVSPQNLHALPQADMLIITDDDFVAQAEALAQIHRDSDQMVVHVVTAQQVYNEYSSGTPDATAYRRFVKMFYDRSQTYGSLAPKYLLLMGDGSWDNRKRFSSRTSGNPYRLLTFQAPNSIVETSAYVTDDYFTFLDDNEGSNLRLNMMDIGVGRIPCNTVEEAENSVEKTKAYMFNQPYGAWRNQAVFMADDDDNNLHTRQADSVATLTQRLYPDLLVQKLFFDAYNQETTVTGESYPSVKRQFDDYIKFGVLMINYMGHGGPTGWANEQVLSEMDLDNMVNTRLPIFLTATCDFTAFDSYTLSGGERLYNNTTGGAGALFTTTRTVFATPNYELNRQFAHFVMARDTAAGYKPYRLGDVMRLSKNARCEQSPNENRLNFTLIGDPAMRLAFASSHTIVADSINGKPITSSLDTVGALDLVTVKGHVEAYQTVASGRTDPSFNGIMTLTVYDKEQDITCVNNEGATTPYVFKAYSNILFQGEVSVKNGLFSAQFMVPKDIRYQVGLSRMVFYAYDPSSGSQGTGCFEGLDVGGENPNPVLDSQGPVMQVYLNKSSFMNGDKVNANPVLIAKLEDEAGINTIGSGIGHDIIMRLDNDPDQEVVLNKYFSTSIDSYTEGEVVYQLADLEEGQHTIYFRCWDLQNNSSEVTLEFKVDLSSGITVDDVMIFPNPTSERATIVFQHDRPSVSMNVTVRVYDLMGHLVYAQTQNVVTDNSDQVSLDWDLVGNKGSRVASGMYIVNLTIAPEGSGTTMKNVKLIVK